VGAKRIIAVAGTYDDVVVKSEGAWKFKRRRLAHDIAGESGLNAPPPEPR
jgi:hypothetical protein